jgi:hypothetical protein
MTEQSEIERSQEQLGKAIERAKMGEDKNLAARIRDLGERLVRTLYGLLKMTEIHDLANKAFDKPIIEFNIVASELYEVLGTLHLVMVEDQVFLNDIRIRMNHVAGNSTLSDELRPHKVGGMSFHRVPTDVQLKSLVVLLCQKPSIDESPRAFLISELSANDLDFIDLTGIYRFRIEGEGQVVKKDAAKISSRASSLIEESWDNLSANRNPNPLPLRRAVTDILSVTKDDEAAGLSSEGQGSEAYGAHALMVCRLSLMIARAVNLSEEALQDLGVAAMFHDMGYAAREGADPKTGFEGYPPPFERHAAAGARLILRQRGFHQAKINRALATLEHHRDFTHDSGKPSIYARIIRIAEDYANFTRRKGGGLNPHEALSRMSKKRGTWYDPYLFQAFVNRMGKYPPGTLLEVHMPLIKDGMLQDFTFVMISQSLVREMTSFAKPLCRLVRTHDGHPCPEHFRNRRIDLNRHGTILRVLDDIQFEGEAETTEA